MQDEVKVSQADIEAVRHFYNNSSANLTGQELVELEQAFARHRHQAERDTRGRMEPVAWMPIRTAPRNETMIVLGGEGQQTWVGFFSGWNNYWTTGEVDRSRDHVMHTPQPTHWMPLPPAPTPQEARHD